MTLTPRSYWTAVWCGFLVLTIGLGVRQSFGIFLKPVSAELHVGRELFSLGTALSMLLIGAVGPFAGRLCDRFGSAPTIAGGGVLYVLGVTQMTLVRIVQEPSASLAVSLAQQMCALMLSGLRVPDAEADMIAAQASEEILHAGDYSDSFGQAEAGAP